MTQLRWLLLMICVIIAAVAVADTRRHWGEWFTGGQAMLRDDLIRLSEP